MDLEHLLGKVEIFIMEITSTTNAWAMEKCTGQMDPSTKVNGLKVYNMAEVS